MRTRFAPSPTGFLHIGSLRTALFAWLLAKKQHGAFVLRIEDTDRAREVPGAVENIVRTLQWAGIAPEEGVTLDAAGQITERGSYGPYTQSKRFDLYRTHADLLLKSGHAYRCFCSAERLVEMRTKQEALHQAPMYDRTCLTLDPAESARRAAAGEPHVVRLKVPHGETITYTDQIFGPMVFRGHAIDDQVLLKSDGFPTYHLANVVDDHTMEIDTVLRGEEWQSSTPKHILLFQAFGWEPPTYAHLPLLLNPDRTKLSKRQGDVAAEDYIRKGYSQEALMNFLALLGWNPGTEQEIFTLDELIQAFSLDRIQRSGAVFDVHKLDWLQGQWMRKIPIATFTDRVRDVCRENLPEAVDDADLPRKASLIQERITFLSEAPEMLRFFYRVPDVPRELLVNAKQKVTADDLPHFLSVLQLALQNVDPSSWSEESLKQHIADALTREGLKLGQLLWPLRAALTGRSYSPGAFEVAAILGKEEVLRRLNTVTLK